MFSRCPTDFLQTLVELLVVSYTSADPFEIYAHRTERLATHAPTPTVIPATVITSTHQLPIASSDVVGLSVGIEDTRVPASFGPFFELNDIEVRDAALEAIHCLCAQSHVTVTRIALIPSTVKLLKRIVESPAPLERHGLKSDLNAAQKAAAILGMLSTDNEGARSARTHTHTRHKTHTHVHTRTHTHTYIHTYTHMYIHTQHTYAHTTFVLSPPSFCAELS